MCWVAFVPSLAFASLLSMGDEIGCCFLPPKHNKCSDVSYNRIDCVLCFTGHAQRPDTSGVQRYYVAVAFLPCNGATCRPAPLRRFALGLLTEDSRIFNAMGSLQNTSTSKLTCTPRFQRPSQLSCPPRLSLFLVPLPLLSLSP